MQRFKSRVWSWRNRTTIRTQLSLIVGFAVTFTMALLITFNYFSQANANSARQVSMIYRVLELESNNLDNYMTELRTFSLQLRNDATFMELAVKTAPLNFNQRQAIESALKTAFYSRGDITDMELFLVRQRLKYSLSRTDRKVALTTGADASLLPDYEIFTAKREFISITADDTGFLRITRTIIDSPRETPLAIVRFTVDIRTVEAFA